MNKKIIITFLFLALSATLAGAFYFLFLSQKSQIIKKNETELAPLAIKSFRGILAKTLTDVRKEEQQTNITIVQPLAEDQNEDAFTFAILGDTQRFNPGPRGNFQRAMAQINKLNPDKIFAVGDLLSSCDGGNSCRNKYTEWKKIVGASISKTYAMQGNHDRTSGDKTDIVWRESFNFPTNGPADFSEQVYSFDFKNSHFVVLDSDKPKEHLVDGEQRAWLEKDLAANQKENIFVFFHEPAYPVSDKATESLDTDPAKRNALWQILEKYNVTAVFNGHEHIVSRRKISGIYQFVFGNTDSFNHGLPAPGITEYANQGQGRFGLVKVNGKEITVETHGPDGSILNSFAFSK